MLVEGQQQPRWQRIHDNTDCCLSHWFLAFEKLTLLIIIIIIHMCNEYTHTLGAMGATLRWSFDWEYFMRWVSADSAIIFYGWMHNSIFHDIFFFLDPFSFSLLIHAKFINSPVHWCVGRISFLTHIWRRAFIILFAYSKFGIHAPHK